MRLIDEAFLDCPYHGSRQMTRHLHRLGHQVGRNRVVRPMRKTGLRATHQKPNTSAPHPEHRVHPCLLRDLAIVRPNQVWCSDITCIPMRRGFLHLVAVMDWHSRRVLPWRLSNTVAQRSHGVMPATPTRDVTFCTEALQEALARHGTPDIFNTDGASQSTSLPFTQMLTDAGVRISMDGRGRWVDNVFIERLWRSLKYECVHLQAFETGLALHAGLLRRIVRYNTRRPHSSLAGRTPDEAYNGVGPEAGGMVGTRDQLIFAANLSRRPGPAQSPAPASCFDAPTTWPWSITDSELASFKRNEGGLRSPPSNANSRC